MINRIVYIIVLNWNGKEDTIECIKSLDEIEYENYKIVIVDNGSGDNSVSDIKNIFPDINVIENNKNLGFAGGNNIGIDFAMANNADYILLLNNDTIVDKNFLSELIDVGESDEKIGLLGPKTYFYSDPKRIWFAGGRVNWMKNSGSHVGIEEIDHGQYDKIRQVDYLTGCCLLIKRQVIEKVGKLSEDYFLYYEDTDLSLRAKNSEYECIYVPKSKIYHKVSRSTKPGSSSYIYYHTRNGLALSKRNGSFLNKILIYPYCLFLFFKQIIKILFFSEKRNWALAVLRGEKDFILGKMGKDISRK
jgi:GT2 family glycosyltransferase